jgi:hypothetical protein
MLIDTEHLHFWMQAIRQSKDPLRTMDAMWSGQLKSKEWLIEALSMQFSVKDDPVSIEIHGGWVGVLASMLFQSAIPIKRITSLDIDPTCESVATMMNKGEEIQGRFQAITGDMCNLISFVDVVINTSCEHITQEQYEIWLGKRQDNQLLVLQSNNYNIDEHVRPANSLEEFKTQSDITVIWEGELKLPLYTRWMIIGKRHVQVQRN